MKVNEVMVGQKVWTVWDDSDEPILATVENIYRGHRNAKLQVQMSDGTRETIYDDQVMALG